MGQAALFHRRVDSPREGRASDTTADALSLLRRALDAVEDGVVISGRASDAATTDILYANSAFVSLLNRVECKGGSRRSDYRRHDQLGENPLWKTVLDSHHGNDVHSCTIKIRNKTGAEIQLQFRSEPIREESARVSRRIAVFRDVTRQAELEESFQRNERLAGLGLLGAGIAHEISNPTASALLAAETALELHDSPDAAEQVGVCLRNIVVSMDRCGRIVRSLLRYSRQAPTEKQACNINDVVAQALELARPSVSSHGTELRADLDAEVPLVPMNPLEIELVLLNLIRNAVEAGNSRSAVSIRTSPIPGGVRVTVADSGSGMNQEQLAHVFDPLFTTRRETGGVGVGMCIAKGIVQGHDGRIEVRSRPGKGTTVFVDLPIAAGALSTPAKAAGAVFGPKEPNDGPTHRL